MRSLQEELTVISPRPEILLYGLFVIEPEIEQSIFCVNGVKPRNNISSFNWGNELGVLNGTLLLSYAIELDDMPDDLDVYLGTILTRINKKGAIFSCLMFDFIFDFHDFLTASVAHGIYGLKLDHFDPQLALSGKFRCSNRWKIIVEKARQQLVANKFILEI